MGIAIQQPALNPGLLEYEICVLATQMPRPDSKYFPGQFSDTFKLFSSSKTEKNVSV
jgi:hypothetical protein